MKTIILEPSDKRSLRKLEEDLLYDSNSFYSDGYSISEGSHDINGKLIIEINGQSNSLLWDRGFEITNLLYDRRLEKKINTTWLPSFVKIASNMYEGEKTDKDNNFYKLFPYTVIHNFLYDYIWLECEDGIVLPYIEKNFKKIISGEKIYYIKWIDKFKEQIGV